MKKAFRIIALALAAVILSVALCSCNYLDSARARQAFYTDETKREIELEGHTYKYLNPNNMEFIYQNDFYDGATFCVTSKDVPVLLASRFGDYMNVSRDKTLLQLFGVGDIPTWYVRDDLYEKMSSLITDAKLEHYYFYYYVPEDQYGGVIQKNELLSDEMTELINRTVSIADEKKVSYKKFGEDDYSKSVTVFACDEDMLVAGSKYMTLFENGKDYYVWDGNTYEEKVLCPVKEEDVPTIKAFFKDKEQAVYDVNIRYDFDFSVEALDYDSDSAVDVIYYD